MGPQVGGWRPFAKHSFHATIISVYGQYTKEKQIMKNVELRVEGDTLMIIVDLKQEFGLSSSGKSITIASTEGNVSVPGQEEVKIGLNVYRPRTKNDS